MQVARTSFSRARDRDYRLIYAEGRRGVQNWPGRRCGVYNIVDAASYFSFFQRRRIKWKTESAGYAPGIYVRGGT